MSYVTDMRVLKAVLEFVAARSAARRITIPEGGGYRNLQDPETSAIITRHGRRLLRHRYGQPRLNVHPVGPDNSGDSLEGISWRG